MPCPPSLEEIRLQDGERSARKAQQLRRELEEARALLLELRTRPGHGLPKDLQDRIDALLAHAAPAPRVGGAPGGPGGWPGLDAAQAWADDAWEAKRTLEVALCEARTLLSRARSFMPPAPELADRLRAAWGAHLAHRHEDRDRVLDNLRILREQTDDPARIATIDDRIAQVNALSDDELMSDRDVLLDLGQIS